MSGQAKTRKLIEAPAALVEHAECEPALPEGRRPGDVVRPLLRKKPDRMGRNQEKERVR